LISGGCVHVVSYDDSTDPQRFAQYLAKYPIDVLKIVPSHLQALLESPEARALLPRKVLILGGETFTTSLAAKIDSLGGSCEVLNHYGPTETTVGSLTLRLADHNWKTSQAASVPIGRPIANTQVYILDALLQPVPTGAIGELYIAGEGVTAGYLNQSERTTERFLPDPFADDSLARMYRTGDLARHLPDGNVEFLGRADDQIKIRGFRIELGEIESVLAREPGVKQAVVMAREDARGEKRLVAYVVADQSRNGAVDQMRTRMREQLPDYMIPSAIVHLAKIPLTTNGKVDRQALPEPDEVQTKSYVAPKTPTEEALAKIWSEVLRRDHVSIDDNFFDLGGHSLLATQVVSRIREQFRVELPIRALFESPTVGGLAAGIANSTQSSTSTQAPAIVRVSREAYRATRS
jgi:acyl-coenzyme A synthetase/AMP-(fatty) acid ligase/acyl carrier protein